MNFFLVALWRSLLPPFSTTAHLSLALFSDEFNFITPWLHRSHYSQASREHSNKQMKTTLLHPVHTHKHTQPWERLHQGRVQNKNLSLDYSRQNKSQHSDTHSPPQSKKNSDAITSTMRAQANTRLEITAPLVKEKYGHTDTHAHSNTHLNNETHTPMHLCCTVHNKSCFIKAKSHPLSVYNHRSRLNRRGNTIPFNTGLS